jgi:cell division protein FtsL
MTERASHVKTAIVCIAVIGAAAMAVGITHVSRRHEAVRAGYELSKATTELRRVQEENRRLRLEQSVLTNPKRIERLARALGMKHPHSGQVRVVRPQRHASRETRAKESNR